MAPESDAEYFELLTKKLFVSGFSWEVVDRKWPRFRAVFYEFDPATVADMPEALVEHISKDPGIIRNRTKINATIKNANEVLKIAAEHGSFSRFLSKSRKQRYDRRQKDIAKRFACVGPNTVYYFLKECGEPIPAFKPPGVG